MGFLLEHNCLLVLSDQLLASMKLEPGFEFKITKDGQRLYPLNVAIEFCDKAEYKYIGKLVITRISIEKDKTTLEGKILKIFSEQESKVFSDNFITPEDIAIPIQNI